MFLQELQHWIYLASIILTSKEFGMIYFFHHISRLSIYIKISALFGWDSRIFYSWKVVIFEINLCQMNLVMFWWFSIATPIFGKSGFTLIAICPGARVLQHPTYIWQVFSHIYCSIILWWFCWLRVPLFRIFSCWLWWRLSSYDVSLWCVIMQLWGDICWHFLGGFASFLLKHYLLSYLCFWMRPAKLILWRPSSWFFLSERVEHKNVSLCSWDLYTLLWGVLSWCCGTLSLSVEWIL